MKLQQRIIGNHCSATVPGAKTKQETIRENNLGRIGNDGETCPYRNSTLINGPDSSANARNTYNIQQFYCVFHSGTFCVTTYLPTDREKSRDSGFCAPESLGIYQLTCFSNLSLSFSAAISAFIWRIISVSSCSHSSLVLA